MREVGLQGVIELFSKRQDASRPYMTAVPAFAESHVHYTGG